ncbi:HAD family hydrolase [Natrialbaceae archaeon A-gly3]
MSYDAVVFDNDGILTTPTRREALLEAISSAYREVGVSAPPTEHVETLVRPDVPSLREIAAEHGVSADRLWEAREQAAIEVQTEEILAGRKRLYDDVSALEAIETPRAIVSNNQHETIARIVDHFDLPAFDPWYGREPTVQGIERKKPTPYYLEKALADLETTEALYVGDSEIDVIAADACDIDSAFVRRSHREDYDLEVEPTYEIDSLEELPGLV